MKMQIAVQKPEEANYYMPPEYQLLKQNVTENLKGKQNLSVSVIITESLEQGSPTWCPRAPGRPHGHRGSHAACSDNSIKMITALTLMNIFNFDYRNDNKIEDKFEKIFI